MLYTVPGTTDCSSYTTWHTQLRIYICQLIYWNITTRFRNSQSKMPHVGFSGSVLPQHLAASVSTGAKVDFLTTEKMSLQRIHIAKSFVTKRTWTAEVLALVDALMALQRTFCSKFLTTYSTDEPQWCRWQHSWASTLTPTRNRNGRIWKCRPVQATLIVLDFTARPVCETKVLERTKKTLLK